MKKFIVAIAALVCMASVSFSQDKKMSKAKTPAKATPAKPSITAVDARAGMAAKPAIPATPAKPSITAASKMKADGTPDKRFKENKVAAGPLKKDGTPDMRYKANKKKG